MVTSPNSSSASQRARRLTSPADAWTHTAPIVPPGNGSLDVPLSVWAQEEPAGLVAGLICDLTTAPVHVAVIGLAADDISDTGHQVVAFHDHRHAPSIREAVPAEAASQVHGVTRENLSNRLVALRHSFNLIVATAEWTRGEGFWPAARVALVRGGYVAIIIDSGNPLTHARIVASAMTAGLGYVQHIVVVTPANLDYAVAGEPDPTVLELPRTALRRCYRDALVFAHGTEGRDA